MKFTNLFKSLFPQIVSICCLLIFCATTISSQQKIWIGNNDNWHDPINWVNLTLPDANSDVRIFGTQNNPKIYNGQTAICRTITVTSLGGLTVDGTLNVDGLGITPQAVIIGAVVNMNGTLNITNAEIGLAVSTTGDLNNLFGTINIGMTGNPLAGSAILNNGKINVLGPINIGSAKWGISNISVNNIQADFVNNDAIIKIGTGNHTITESGINNTGKFRNVSPITIDNAKLGIVNSYDAATDMCIFENGATIDIGKNGLISDIGVFNSDDFYNNEFGNINIDNTGSSALVNQNLTFTVGHEFVNKGTISIGQNGAANTIVGSGISNQVSANLTNEGTINIDHTMLSGYNNFAITENFGTINIGQSSNLPFSISERGIVNQGKFNNKSGLIKIDRTQKIGLLNLDNSNVQPLVDLEFVNNAQIEIGLSTGINVSINEDGIVNQTSRFVNQADGIITIDNCVDYGLINNDSSAGTTTLSNEGKMIVRPRTKGLFNSQSLVNEVCAEMELEGMLTNNSNGVITNDGYFETVYNSGTHQNIGTVTNNGILYYALCTSIPNVVNNEIEVDIQAAPASACPVLDVSDIMVAVPLDMNITFWQDAGTTQTAGVYDPNTSTLDMTNAFSPPSGGNSILYINVDDLANGCSKVLPWIINLLDCAPVFTQQPSDITKCPGEGGTMTAVATNTPNYQWQVNTGGSFVNLTDVTPYSGTMTSTLSISDITGLDGNTYRCVASDGQNTTNSNPAPVNELPCPANNFCANAIDVSCGHVVQGSTLLASFEPLDDCVFEFPTVFEGVWYQLTGNGTITTASTCSANAFFPPEVRIYEGTCSNLVCSVVGFDAYSSCNFGGQFNTISFLADLGKEYYVFVSPDAFGFQDDFELSITCDPCNDLSDPDLDGIAACFDLCPNDQDVSLNFNSEGNNVGSSDYVEVPHDPVFNLTDGDFSFEAWVNPVGSGFKTIVSKGHGASANTSYIFEVLADPSLSGFPAGKLALYLGDGNTLAEWQYSDSSVPLNAWSHVAVSVDNSGASPVATFYLNGVVDGVKTYINVASIFNGDTNPLFIGRQGWSCSCNFFDGSMDELAIWDKTLSVADIAASMAAPYAGTESSLVAYYDFNDANACVANGANTTLVDKANAYNGTLINFDLVVGCSSNWTSGHNMGACVPVGCPANVDLTGTQGTNAVYESSNYISSDQTINTPAEVDYDATTEITLLENFEVISGAQFHAFIDGCN